MSAAADGGDAQADVYILDSPDGEPEKLTTLPGQHRHPAWSPDRSEIAYALWNGATDRDIWIRTVGQTGSARLEISPLIEEDRPAFSPDGTKIAYESEVTDGSGQEDILIANADGSGDPVNLTSSPGVIENKPVWSPDGSTIYYSFAGTAGADDADIVMEPSDNSDVVIGAENMVLDTTANEFQPALSPDGTRLCFTRAPAGAFNTATNDNADVYTVASSGVGSIVNLSDSAVGDYNCAWSPDGTKIAYVTGIFSNGALMYEDSDDSAGAGQADPLVDNSAGNFDGNPDWAANPSPICEDTTAETTANDPVTVPLPCTDPEDDPLTPSIVTQPLDGGLGAIDQDADTVRYTPDGGFLGTDTFTFKANDGTSDSNAATATIKVSATCRGRKVNIAGSDGRDNIRGSGGNDVIAAFDGKDKVNGRGGKDVICGGDGGDRLKGKGANDKLFGEAGKDKLKGGSGKDKCVGGGGKDKADCEKEKSI